MLKITTRPYLIVKISHTKEIRWKLYELKASNYNIYIFNYDMEALISRACFVHHEGPMVIIGVDLIPQDRS
jgi:hypothetical protein